MFAESNACGSYALLLSRVLNSWIRNRKALSISTHWKIFQYLSNSFTVDPLRDIVSEEMCNRYILRFDTQRLQPMILDAQLFLRLQPGSELWRSVMARGSSWVLASFGVSLNCLLFLFSLKQNRNVRTDFSKKAECEISRRHLRWDSP